MTSGTSVSIKNFSWALGKSKKRHRSGSGGSKDHEAKKKSFTSKRQQQQQQQQQNGAESARIRSSSSSPPVGGKSDSGCPASGLEIVAPVTADVEFKFTWNIRGFLRLAKGSGDGDVETTVADRGNGLDSRSFDVNVNGMETKWNLSVRFWTGEDGERLANPFVLCLNLLSCKRVSGGDEQQLPTTVGVRFKFGVLNRASNRLETGAPEERPDLRLEDTSELRCVGYRNLAIADKHLGGGRDGPGDLRLVCRLRLMRDDSDLHSLASDLRCLLDGKTPSFDSSSQSSSSSSTASTSSSSSSGAAAAMTASDLELETSEGKRFRVHKNILAARSPVLADMIRSAEEKQKQQLHQQKTEESQNVEKDEEKKQDADSKTSKSISSIQSNPVFPSRERLRLSDVKASSARELLSYIYTDSTARADSMAPALLAAADSYALPGLKRRCERLLGEALSPANVSSALLLADRHGCGSLRRSALEYCRDNHTYIMKDSDWKTIEEERPGLFQEAVREAVGGGKDKGEEEGEGLCSSHEECLKRRGKRYEIERNSSLPKFDLDTLEE